MSDTDEIEIVLRHLSVVRIEPGDTLVFRSTDRLSHEVVARLADQIRAVFPDGTKVVFLDAGMELSVLRGPGPIQP